MTKVSKAKGKDSPGLDLVPLVDQAAADGLITYGLLFDILEGKEVATSVSRQEFISTLYPPHQKLVAAFHFIDAKKQNKITGGQLQSFMQCNDFAPDKTTYQSAIESALKTMVPKSKQISPQKRRLLALLGKNTLPEPKVEPLPDTDTIAIDDFLEALCIEHWDLMEIFRFIDTDNNGTLSTKELKTFLKDNENTRLGARLMWLLEDTIRQTILSGKEDALFEKLDMDGDDKIYPAEFISSL